jgi:hypothetical protein
MDLLGPRLQHVEDNFGSTFAWEWRFHGSLLIVRTFGESILSSQIAGLKTLKKKKKKKKNNYLNFFKKR